ncbi:MAG TPA: hypothetical protein DCS55_17880 [Acidimicrobiaceae bacterium]|nr:hypothetical protein [Acidimicrobiaceae bacterium]
MARRHARPAARCAAGLLGGVAAYQAALAGGAPFGDTVYGGRADTVDGVLSPPYRVASAGAAVALSAAAWTVAAHAGLVPPGKISRRTLTNGTRAVAGFLAVNTVANAASTNPLERWLLGSVTGTSSALCLIVLRAGNGSSGRSSHA